MPAPTDEGLATGIVPAASVHQFTPVAPVGKMADVALARLAVEPLHIFKSLTIGAETAPQIANYEVSLKLYSPTASLALVPSAILPLILWPTYPNLVVHCLMVNEVCPPVSTAMSLSVKLSLPAL